jgi:hypothetical protein
MEDILIPGLRGNPEEKRRDFDREYTEYCVGLMKNPDMAVGGPQQKYSMNRGWSPSRVNEYSRNLKHMGRNPKVFVKFIDGDLYVEFEDADFVLMGAYNKVQERLEEMSRWLGQCVDDKTAALVTTNYVALDALLKTRK